MGFGFREGGTGSYFKATLQIFANPSVTVTVASSKITYTVTTGIDGRASVVIKKKGTYQVSSSAGGSSEILIRKSGRIYSTDITIVNPVTTHVVTYASNQALIYWDIPTEYYSSVKVYRYSDYNANTGEYTGEQLLYEGVGTNYVKTNTETVKGYLNTGLTTGAVYYYLVKCVYQLDNRTYEQISDFVYIRYEVPASSIGVVQTITSTCTWSVPEGWRKIQVFCVGGGGSGSARHDDDDAAGTGGGGGGFTRTSEAVSVVPGQSFSIVVGAGGSARTTYGDGIAGGTTTFGSLVSANGGAGGYNAKAGLSWASGGNGGSGGGAGSSESTTPSYIARGAAGGTNGGNGGSNRFSAGAVIAGGTGQGRTTRAFNIDNTSSTQFSGGGGGGGSRGDSSKGGGAGGNRGGGNGGSGLDGAPYAKNATSGTDGTGGGGGGGAMRHNDGTTFPSGAGGSGVILVKCVA